MAQLRGLQSRLAIVTGAAQGIGWQTARTLQDAGMRVAAVDRAERWQTGEIAGSCKHRMVSFPQTDIAQPEDVEHLFVQLAEQFAGQVPHLLVNCAGITRDAML